MQKMRLLQWVACLMLIVSLVVPNVAWAHADGEEVKVRLLGLNGLSYEAYLKVQPTEYVNTAGEKVKMDKPTAMGALVELAEKYYLSYSAQTSAYGVYVTEIAGLKAQQINKNTGWTVYVNGQAPQVGADSIEVHDGDVVTWSYVDFMKTLYPKVELSTTTPQLGEEVTVTVTAEQTTYDENWNPTTKSIPVPGATVFWAHGVNNGTDAPMPVTDENGVVKIKPKMAGPVTLAVYKDSENGVAEMINSGESYLLVGNKNAHYPIPYGYEWAKTYIDQLAAKGILHQEAEMFYADFAVRRMELAELLALSGDLKFGGSATFTDMPYPTPYIQTAARLGYMIGDAEGTFRPTDYITREEFAIVLTKFAGVNATDATNATVLNFSDHAKISTWATPYVKAAVANGLLVGDAEGTFRPKANLKIAEVVTALTKVINKQAK